MCRSRNEVLRMPFGRHTGDVSPDWVFLWSMKLHSGENRADACPYFVSTNWASVTYWQQRPIFCVVQTNRAKIRANMARLAKSADSFG